VLSFETGRRIFIARAVTDMRKSFNTLAALVEHQLGHDPFAGDVFVFIGIRRRWTHRAQATYGPFVVGASSGG
jgi:transposase